MYEMRCKIIKSIVFAICLSALITESYYLYFDYKDYQTVVTVNIERPSLVEYPAVSVCEILHFVNVNHDFYGYSTISIPNGLWIRAKQNNSNQFKNIVSNKSAISYVDFGNIFLKDDLLVKDIFGPNDHFITCTKGRTGEPCTPVNQISGFFSECKTFFSRIQFNDSYNVLPKKTFKIVENARDNEMAV